MTTLALYRCWRSELRCSGWHSIRCIHWAIPQARITDSSVVQDFRLSIASHLLLLLWLFLFVLYPETNTDSLCSSLLQAAEWDYSICNLPSLAWSLIECLLFSFSRVCIHTSWKPCQVQAVSKAFLCRWSVDPILEAPQLPTGSLAEMKLLLPHTWPWKWLIVQNPLFLFTNGQSEAASVWTDPGDAQLCPGCKAMPSEADREVFIAHVIFIFIIYKWSDFPLIYQQPKEFYTSVRRGAGLLISNIWVAWLTNLIELHCCSQSHNPE